MSPTIRPEHLRQPGHSAPCPRDEMLRRVARFADRETDPGAFPDLKQQEGKRSVSYRLSPGNLGGPAPIDAPHNFHLSISELSKGIRPTVHSHPYNEVFMPLDARFRLYWGEELAESIDLEPFDIVSVPAGVFRTFENLDDHAGHMLAIFDHGGDPHTGIVVPPDVYEKFYRSWNPGMVGVQHTDRS
jgi:quercetin dioxygenase-like cupin family protein